jgi:hypothetical protein
MSPLAKASKAVRTASSLGWAMTPPFPRTGSGSLRLDRPALNDPPVLVAPYLAGPGLDDAPQPLVGVSRQPARPRGPQGDLDALRLHPDLVRQPHWR